MLKLLLDIREGRDLLVGSGPTLIIEAKNTLKYSTICEKFTVIKLIRTQIFADYVQKENSITFDSKSRLGENPISEDFNDSLVGFSVLKSYNPSLSASKKEILSRLLFWKD